MPESGVGPIGRGEELRTLVPLLLSPERRLLTLTGPPGIGKTALAAGLASAVADRFPDGVLRVDLIGCGSAAEAATLVAARLDLGQGPTGSATQRLCDHLHGRAMLLVLDSCEAVPDLAPLVSALLSGARALLVVATSQARLRIASEREYAVPPLAMPDAAVEAEDVDRLAARLRVRLGYPPDVPLLAAAVGGTAVGRPLLDLVAEGFAHLRKEVSDAQMTMLTGPRIAPAEIPDVEGLTAVAYLPEAYAHLAAADAAVVQGGLSTTMELVAAQRPFLYFPLARHWEQQHYVTHRLDHYRAGTRLDHASTTPTTLAEEMRAAMGRRPSYRPVPRDGAALAAARIASLLGR